MDIHFGLMLPTSDEVPLDIEVTFLLGGGTDFDLSKRIDGQQFKFSGNDWFD
jgi:hypothetical protein